MHRRFDDPSAESPAPRLVEARLAPPELRSGVVERDRIHRALDGDADVRLVLVAAPPGYGKTTAVRSWCARRSADPAWVTLDPDDDDPVRLWTYIATALERQHAGLGRQALTRLARSVGSVDTAVDELANAIAAHGGELTIVLDELQRVTSEDALASIDRALVRLPSSVRLVALTRADPALQLGRLRAAGALREVRADTLAFTTTEAAAVLESLGCATLDPADLELLQARTEGWPAAIVLTGMWLTGVRDPHRALLTFGADKRFVTEYLSQEVLASLEDDLRSFLLRASVLRELDAALCDHALGRDDSAAVLERLGRSNALVERLERTGWYRVHPLFAEFAALQLDAAEPGAAVELHRRAAHWLRSQGLPSEALRHAGVAEDHDLIAEILVESHLPFVRTGRSQTLLDAVRALPDRSLVERPALAAAAAAASAIAQPGGTIERRRLLGLVERSDETGGARPPRDYPRAVADMVRAATVDDDVRGAIAAGRRAVSIAEAGADDVLVAALAGLARALFFGGELDGAQACALRAVEHPDAERRVPGHLLARSTLSLIAVEQGRQAIARTHAEKARSLASTIGGGRAWLGAGAAAATGAVLAAEGELAAAEHELAHAEHVLRDEVATVHHTWALLLLAHARCRRGRLGAASDAAKAAETELSALRDGGRLGRLAAVVAAELDAARARATQGEVLEQPTAAELAVLRLLPTDLSAREIGAELYLSHNTVRTHTQSLYRKLGVRSRSDAVARATVLGLVEHGRPPRSPM